VGPGSGPAAAMRKRPWAESVGLREHRLLLALLAWVASHHWSVVALVVAAAHLRRLAAPCLTGGPCQVAQHRSSAADHLAGRARAPQGTMQLMGAHILHRRWAAPCRSREAGSPAARLLVGVRLHTAVPTRCRLGGPSHHDPLVRRICQVDRQVVQLHTGVII